MNCSHHKIAHFRFNDVCAAPVKMSLRRELEIDLWSAKNKAQQIPTIRNENRVKELEEQIRICDAMTQEGKELTEALALRKSLREFERTTQRMTRHYPPLQIENADGTYTQEFDTFSDADPGL